MKKIFTQILLFLILAVIVILLVQNLHLVEINFLNQKIELSLFLALTIFYILGAVSGGMLITLIRLATNRKAEKPKELNGESDI